MSGYLDGMELFSSIQKIYSNLIVMYTHEMSMILQSQNKMIIDFMQIQSPARTGLKTNY
jgi:hypothetical protein